MRQAAYEKLPIIIDKILNEYVDKIIVLYGKHTTNIILYGSYARGCFTQESDLDIMILVDLTGDEIKGYSSKLSELTFDINLDNDVMLMPIVKKEEHFKYWLPVYPFYNNVYNEGVTLYAA